MENSMSRNKKRRRNVDRISVLPEALLLHILSFLPIKEAVATSLLSKKWRALWRSLPVLDFNRKNFRNLPSFQLFVDKVLNSVDLKSVKKFVLNISSYKPSAKASEWINAVIRNKGEHLELRLRWPYEFPSNVLIANTMRVLKLNGVTVATLSHVNLPLLEVLHLEDVKSPVFASLEILLNACPLLEDLAVRFPYGVDYEPLNIGRLHHLVTAEVPQSLIPLEALSNATILRFIHEGKWPSTFSDDMPMFNNLIHLECVADEWTRMVNCLHSFPKLEKLVISELDSPPPAEPILEVPSCVALHLKEFILCFFGGSESESEMVKFMVENGGVLRTVYICADSDEYKIRKCKNLAAYLRSGTESCSQMHEQPLVFMIS